MRSVGLVTWAAAVVLSLCLLSSIPGAFERSDRIDDTRAPITEGRPLVAVEPGVRIQDRSTIYRGGSVTIVVLDGVPSARPPGVRRLPRPGEIVASRALARILRQPTARGELAHRLPGRLVGEVTGAGLGRPGELLAYVALERPADAPEQGSAPLLGWGHPAALVRREGFSPAFLAGLATVLAVPLLGLGVLAITAGSTSRAVLIGRLRLLGAPAGSLRSLIVAEAGLPLVVGLLAGIGVRPWMAGLLAGSWPPTVRPFGSDVLSGASGVMARSLVAAAGLAIAAVGCSCASTAEGPYRALRQRQVPLVRIVGATAWVALLGVLCWRVVANPGLGGADVALALVALLLTGWAQPAMTLIVLRAAAVLGSAPCRLAEASFARGRSATSRSAQAMAVAGAGLALAAAAIVVWDAASLVDAGFGRRGASASDAVAIGDGAAQVRLDRMGFHDLVRVRYLDGPSIGTRSPTRYVVFRCRDGAQLVRRWTSDLCDDLVVVDGPGPWPRRVAPFLLGGVRRPGGRVVARRPRASLVLFGGTSSALLPVSDAVFSALERAARAQRDPGHLLVHLSPQAERRSRQVEQLREALVPPPWADRGWTLRPVRGNGSEVLLLSDSDVAAHWYHDVYGSGARLLAELAAGLAALAFLLGTLADAAESQATTDRLEVMGASKGFQLRLAMWRSGTSLVVALSSAVFVGTALGLRYVRAAGYQDVLHGWTMGYPVGAVVRGAGMALVAGGLTAVLGSAVAVRPRALERLRGR